MPFIYRNLSISPQDDENSLPLLVAGQLELPPALLRDFRVVRKGIDARKKPRVKLVYTVSFMVDDERSLRSRIADAMAPHGLEWVPEVEPARFPSLRNSERIVIVGSGPAGLFAALRLTEYGLNATLIERGQPVEQRARDVQQFWRNGILNPESNVQFGEGGAGTFSDGKLTSRSRDALVPWVLERLVDFGAQPEVRYLAKPHIGTDRLRRVVASLRTHLLERGVNVCFSSRLSDLIVRDGRCRAIVVNDCEELACDRLILATGHSARDTYELLQRRGVPMERKAFAMGLRVEHPQALIDAIQYGGTRHPNLPPADYALAWNNRASGRSAYSFCMCPGGVVVAGASEQGGVVTNGMSGQLRNSPLANSALVVNVTPDDFGGPGPLAGIHFQRHWERKAFSAGGGDFRAPAQGMFSFLGLPGQRALSSSYRPGIVETELDQVLPPFVISTLRDGLVDFNRRMRGFICAEAVLVGIESRTSAPVRIVRDERFESIGIGRLYPAGEGAGYAGGIMSSAIDGVRIADTIAASLGDRA